jgi:predicted DNA-binding protein
VVFVKRISVALDDKTYSRLKQACYRASADVPTLVRFALETELERLEDLERGGKL